MKKELTFYCPSSYHGYAHIKKKTISYDDSDANTKVVIEADGAIKITYVDACESGHNGDFYDGHDYGWITYKKEKADLIRYENKRHKESLEYLRKLKENNE